MSVIHSRRTQLSKRDKRKAEMGSEMLPISIGVRDTKTIRTYGGNETTLLKSTNVANVFDPKTNKHEVVPIETVVTNPANRHYARANVMTRGAIIRTKLGKARITSRPGQDAMVNAVLVEEKKE